MSTLLGMTDIPWLDQLVEAILSLIVPVLVLASVAGMIYAIVVGIQFIKAEDKSKRDEAKQKLIYVIVGIVVTLLLIALFYFLATNIGDNINPLGWL
ncbi:MAG: hypothetical protein E7374_00530 [Clostridiales bacterium]|nr:hypothetical protein [Clostridiales bacterium]